MRIAAIAAMLFVIGSVAQAQQVQQTPLEQALFQRLSGEIEANVRANAKIIELQQQLASAQESIKRLTPLPGEAAPAAK